MKEYMQKSRQSGFTLAELMAVVVIVAILASIALPSYREQVKRAARADAKAALMENAQFLEQNFTETNRYDQDSAGDPISLPFTQSPREDAAKYTIAVVATATTFILTAAPVVGGMMDGDACGSFTLNQLGQKSVVNATKSASECWAR
jgi:type IV pilus assembly protein PilE